MCIEITIVLNQFSLTACIMLYTCTSKGCNSSWITLPAHFEEEKEIIHECVSHAETCC